MSGEEDEDYSYSWSSTSSPSSSPELSPKRTVSGASSIATEFYITPRAMHGHVLTMALDESGAMLFVGGDNGLLARYRIGAASAEVQRRFDLRMYALEPERSAHTRQSTVDGLAFDATSNRLYVGVGKQVLALDATSGELQCRRDVKTDVKALDRHEQRLLVGSYGETFTVDPDDIVSNERYLTDDESTLGSARHLGTKCARFSPDGHYIAVASRASFVLVYAGAEPPFRLERHTDSVWAVAFNAASTRLVSGAFDGAAIVWDLSTRQELYHCRVNGHGICTVAFVDDAATIMTGGGGGNLRVWRAGELVSDETPHRTWINDVRIVDDYVFTSSDDKRVGVHRLLERSGAIARVYAAALLVFTLRSVPQFGALVLQRIAEALLDKLPFDDATMTRIITAAFVNRDVRARRLGEFAALPRGRKLAAIRHRLRYNHKDIHVFGKH